MQRADKGEGEKRERERERGGGSLAKWLAGGRAVLGGRGVGWAEGQEKAGGKGTHTGWEKWWSGTVQEDVFRIDASNVASGWLHMLQSLVGDV